MNCTPLLNKNVIFRLLHALGTICSVTYVRAIGYACLHMEEAVQNLPSFYTARSDAALRIQGISGQKQFSATCPRPSRRANTVCRLKAEAEDAGA